MLPTFKMTTLIKKKMQLSEKPATDGLDADNEENLIASLKEKIEKENIDITTNDEYLRQFLHTRKMKSDAAFTLIKNYVNYKKLNPHLMNISHELIDKVLRSKVISICVSRDANNRIAMFLKLGLWDPDEFGAEVLLQTAILMGETLMWHTIYKKQPPISGVIVVIDLQHVTLSHVRHLTPAFARNYVKFTADCLPFKLLAAHLMNTNITLSILVSLFKRFMNEKSKKRILFHGNNVQSLQKHIPREILPVELNGANDEDSVKVWTNILNIEYIKDKIRSSGFIVHNASCEHITMKQYLPIIFAGAQQTLV